MTRKRNAAKSGNMIELLTDVLYAGSRRILKKATKPGLCTAMYSV